MSIDIEDAFEVSKFMVDALADNTPEPLSFAELREKLDLPPVKDPNGLKSCAEIGKAILGQDLGDNGALLEASYYYNSHKYHSDVLSKPK